MKSSKLITSNLSKWLLLALVLTLVPAALAKNTWYVDGVNGNDNNDCLSSQSACQTIGHAISLCSSGDTIMVAPSIYMENLTINFSLKIIGADPATTIVDGNQAGTVFTINSPANVVLSKLTIRNGLGGDAGGILNEATLAVNHSTISGNSASSGGGILNWATLTINHSTITGNSANNTGGGVSNYGPLTLNKSTISSNSAGTVGGGIYNDFRSTLTLNKSTLSDNSATDEGGGIDNWGSLTISNGTISGNSAGWDGGGVYNNGEHGGGLTINNGTIAGNSAGAGGGIYQEYGSTTLQNSIVANNPGGNCGSFKGFLTSLGYNLSSDDTCNLNGPGDMNNTKPLLGKFGNHGGPTQTIPLLPGSPAIDAGNPNGCTDDKGNLLKTDQRGWARPGKYDQGKRCDMGAVERQHE